ESPQHFLVAAEAESDRALYGRTLLRRFPTAAITDAGVAGALVLAPQASHYTGAVVNITGAGAALRLVSALRKANPKLPIVAVCSVDRSVDAFAVGASRFLLSTEWLMIGAMLSDVIEIARRNEQKRWADSGPPSNEDAAGAGTFVA
ncbi:MAG TPA: hypothetical protein VK477_06855, partial [Acidobacteriota bacterium]|nr:hypothetical protein [Acidobacteriota bacterium]